MNNPTPEAQVVFLQKIDEIARLTADNKKLQNTLEASKNWKKIKEDAMKFIEGTPDEILEKIKGLVAEFTELQDVKTENIELREKLANAEVSIDKLHHEYNCEHGKRGLTSARLFEVQTILGVPDGHRSPPAAIEAAKRIVAERDALGAEIEQLRSGKQVIYCHACNKQFWIELKGLMWEEIEGLNPGQVHAYCYCPYCEEGHDFWKPREGTNES